MRFPPLASVRARVTARVERAELQVRSGRGRWVVLGIALVVFGVVTALAVRDLPALPPGRGRPVLFAGAAALAALGVVVNGAEYALSVRAIGGRVTFSNAMRISVFSTAANLMPIPGAALVKTRAMQLRGVGLRVAATLTIGIGIIWVGVAGLVAGVFVASAGGHLGAALPLVGGGLVVSTLGGVILAGPSTPMSTGALVTRAFVIEIVSVGLQALRFYCVLHAIGFGGSLAQSATLGASAVVAGAAGVFPGGLGLRELLSSIVGPAVGLAAAVAAVVAAVERIVSLAVVAVIALGVLVIDRSSRRS